MQNQLLLKFQPNSSVIQEWNILVAQSTAMQITQSNELFLDSVNI